MPRPSFRKHAAGAPRPGGRHLETTIRCHTVNSILDRPLGSPMPLQTLGSRSAAFPGFPSGKDHRSVSPSRASRPVRPFFVGRIASVGRIVPRASTAQSYQARCLSERSSHLFGPPATNPKPSTLFSLPPTCATVLDRSYQARLSEPSKPCSGRLPRIRTVSDTFPSQTKSSFRATKPGVYKSFQAA